MRGLVVLGVVAVGVVAAGIGTVLGGCGSSPRMVQQSNAYFERCHTADFDPAIDTKAKRECWDKWLVHYTLEQPPERIRYARQRLAALERGETVDPLPGLATVDQAQAVSVLSSGGAALEETGQAPNAAPPNAAPRNAPPTEAPPTDGAPPVKKASAPEVQRRAPPSGDLATPCVPVCAPRWRACVARCDGNPEGCEGACDTEYRVCMRGCY